MKGKQRLSASVDADLLAAATAAAQRGRVRTISAWVNDALRLKLEHDQRLQALASFIDAYEAEHGEINQGEMDRAARRARSRAAPVRGRRPQSWDTTLSASQTSNQLPGKAAPAADLKLDFRPQALGFRISRAPEACNPKSEAPRVFITKDPAFAGS